MRLNQPVNLYLPEKVQIRDQGFDQPVRVANLMDHSPGFEDRALGQLFERDYGRVRPLDVYLRQERPRRVRPPGVLTSYSNYGAALGGLAVSYAAGKPFERLVEDEILVPLGMSHTTFREPHEPKAGLPDPMPTALVGEISDGYRWTPVGFARRDFEFIGQIAPAGAASSTAGDMARYMLMQLGGGQSGGVTIYGPVAAQAFRTPLRQTPPGINGWAHGFMVFDLPGGHRGYGHGGATLSFFSNMVVVPDLNLGVFISTNTDTGRPLVSSCRDRDRRRVLRRAACLPARGFAGAGPSSRDVQRLLHSDATNLARAGRARRPRSWAAPPSTSPAPAAWSRPPATAASRRVAGWPDRPGPASSPRRGRPGPRLRHGPRWSSFKRSIGGSEDDRCSSAPRCGASPRRLRCWRP